MGLLSGSLSVTRCTVSSRPSAPDLEPLAFREIEPGSEVRERVGVVPFEPGAPYQIGHARWAFRVRVDRRKPDPGAVAERLKVLEAAERDARGFEVVPARTRKRLRHEAEEELLARTAPRTKVIECVLDDQVLWLGTTANAWLGLVLEVLRGAEIVAELAAPWLARAEPDLESELVDARQPWQSVRGCRFLKRLIADPELMVEPESGAARLVTRDAKVSLTGEVTGELSRYLERDSELLAARLLLGDASFRLDGLNWRLSAIRLETDHHDSWVDRLAERVEAVSELYARLERKYEELMTG